MLAPREAKIQPTKEIFVGRSVLQEQFRKTIAAPTVYWAISITGQGGIGKTRLLQRLKQISREAAAPLICAEDIIDFYDAKNQNKLGILTTIRDNLGRSAFRSFTGLLTRYDRNKPESWQERAKAEERVITAFVQAFQKLADGQRIVLLFDTFEVVAESEFGLWFLNELLPQLQSSSIVVIAGRPEPAWQDSLAAREGVLTVQLPFFTPAEVAEYFQEAGEAVEPSFTYQVAELSEGRPLFIALLIDWLREDYIGQNINELQASRQENFERILIEGINDLSTIENQIILTMAHVYHYLDAEMLSYLFPQEFLKKDQPDEVIVNLLRFSFVKQRQQGCVLHDEMRELVTKYIWDIQDPAQYIRQQISHDILKYFEKKLAEERERPEYKRNQRRIDVLTLEYLYHRLYSDLENSYAYLGDLLEEARQLYRHEHINNMLRIADEINQKRLYSDKVLDRQIKAARAWILEATWQQIDTAIALTNEIIADPAGVKRLQATALVIRGLIIVRQGQHQEAVRDLEWAYKLYTELYDDLVAGKPLPGERGMSTLEEIKPERHLILNSLGYVYSDLGRFTEAQKHFTAALALSQAENDRDWEASALTNLAHINRWLGNLQEALNLAYMSLAIRQRLGRPVLVAISYNALGMIYRDDGDYVQAQKFFEQARQIFKEFHVEWREAQVLRNLGWLSHLRHEHAEALTYIKDAHAIVARLDARRELPDLLHKEGRVYYALGDLAKAKERLENCVELAEQFNDAYLTANTFAELGRIAYTAKQYEAVPEYCRKALEFKEKGYLLFPIYGKTELLLGDLANTQGNLDKAFEHYGQAYSYWVRHNEWRLQRRLDHLREKLLELPPDQRQRQAKRLAKFWQNKEADIANRYPYILSLLQQFSRDS